MVILLSLLSGILTALTFPKWNMVWLAWVSLIPFMVALDRAGSLRRALACGFFFGIAFFGIDLCWVFSLFRFVGWWTVLGWILFVIFQALFILLFVLLVRRIKYRLILVPACWVVVEYLRAWGPFGVPAGGLGYTQVSFLPLIQIASLVSVYGISFLIVLTNTALAEWWLDRRRWKLLMAVVVFVGLFVGYGYFILSQPIMPAERVLSVALIQPNIDQKDKIDASRVSDTFSLQEKMSRFAAGSKPDVIIWPETAVFTYLVQDPVLFPRMQQLAKDTRCWFLCGTPYLQDGKAYNTVVALSPSGEIVSYYNKEHLVPFGEYLPFRPMLYPLLKSVGYYDSEFASGMPRLLEFAGCRAATGICFESTFPALIKKRVWQGADFILVVTNDAWFGASSAPYFHLNTSILRAVENRKYVVQVGNTGISAVIDPWGRIITQSKLNQREIVFSTILIPPAD